ncbi:hypothetical protein JTB14_019751 [Gonioctena quinquepunctata]|nr:hypothetical protein JTB14_019751 [Gonioctena quinquepunctata]
MHGGKFATTLFPNSVKKLKKKNRKLVQVKWKNLRDAFIESSPPSTLQESQDDLDQSQDHNVTQDRQLVDVNRETQTQVEWTPSRRKKSALESKFITHIDSHIKQPSPVIQNLPKETDDLAFFRSLQTS